MLGITYLTRQLFETTGSPLGFNTKPETGTPST